MNSVIAKKNDEANYITMDNLDCFVPRNDVKKSIYFVTIPTNSTQSLPAICCR